MCCVCVHLCDAELASEAASIWEVRAMSRGVVLSLFPCQYLLERSTCIIIDSLYQTAAKGPSPSGDRDQSGDESPPQPTTRGGTG